MKLGLNKLSVVIISGLLIIPGLLVIAGLLIIAELRIPVSASSATQIGFVNVDHVFKSSIFIKEANKKIQADLVNMNQQLKHQKATLRELIKQYHATKSDEGKASLNSKLKIEQLVLENLTTSFQKKIRQDEATGKQHFDELLRAATERVAKEKHINVVITEQAILYTDKSWVDLTAEVERAL